MSRIIFVFCFLCLLSGVSCFANDAASNSSVAFLASLEAQAQADGGVSLRGLDKISEELNTTGVTPVMVLLKQPQVFSTLSSSDWNNPSRLSTLHAATAAASKSVLARATNSGGVHVRQIYKNWAGFSCNVTAAGLSALLDDPDVLSIEATQIAYAQTKQGIPLMNAYSATRLHEYRGDGIAIAIVDTGVDYTHPQLGGSSKIGDFPNNKVIGGHNFGDVQYPDDPHPLVAGGDGSNAHGTSCAGLTSGDVPPAEETMAGNFVGGVAQNSKVYALKITTADQGSCSLDTIAAAWDWCVSHQKDDAANPLMIISTSFGGGYYEEACDLEQPTLYMAALSANKVGITIFASSGNDGYCNAIAAPAALSNVISVGAVYDADIGKIGFEMSPESCLEKSVVFETTAADKVTCYSNSSVDLLDIFASSHNASTCDIVEGGYDPSNYTQDFGGTSAACPYAAGAAAVIQQTVFAKTGAYLTPEELKEKMTSTGDFITDTLKNPLVIKPRVNLGKAIQDLVPQKGFLTVTIAPAAALTLGAAWSIDDGITWNESGKTLDLPILTKDGEGIIYTVIFKEIEGWETPDPQLTKLIVDETTELTGTYSSLETFDIQLWMSNLNSLVDKPFKPGDKIDFSWTALATNSITDPFWFELFASKTGGFDVERTGVAITESYKLNRMPELLKTVTRSLTLNSIADGIYTLMPSVNRGTINGALFENYYKNNWHPLAGKRVRIHNTNTTDVDLYLSDMRWVYSDKNNTKVSFNGLINNGGSESLVKPGCWIEVFYGTLTAEGTLMPQGTIGAGVQIPELPAGTNVSFSISGTVPDGAHNKALAVVVDSTNIVPESIEVNNMFMVYDESLLPPGKDNGIDLAVKSITIDGAQISPRTVAPGNTLKFTVQVENKGTTVPEGQVYLELFGSQNGGISVVPGATLTYSKLIDPPAVGTTKTYQLEQKINSIGDGVYTPVVMVNRMAANVNPGDMTPLDNRKVYADGMINIQTPTTATPKANIVWSDGPYFSTDIRTGKMSVFGRIKNTGTERTVPFWTEAFLGTKQYKTEYFYKQPGAVFAAGVHCDSLAPNAEKEIRIVGPATHGKIVGVLADSTDTVNEMDETDNYGYSSVIR